MSFSVAFYLIGAVFLVAKAITMWRGPGGEAELTASRAVLGSQPDVRRGWCVQVAVQAATCCSSS